MKNLNYECTQSKTEIYLLYYANGYCFGLIDHHETIKKVPDFRYLWNGLIMAFKPEISSH